MRFPPATSGAGEAFQRKRVFIAGTPRVLIVGATSIIARELALQFARAGAALCLAARDRDELERVGADLRLRSGATVHQRRLFSGTWAVGFENRRAAFNRGQQPISQPVVPHRGDEIGHDPVPCLLWHQRMGSAIGDDFDVVLAG